MNPDNSPLSLKYGRNVTISYGYMELEGANTGIHPMIIVVIIFAVLMVIVSIVLCLYLRNKKKNGK